MMKTRLSMLAGAGALFALSPLALALNVPGPVVDNQWLAAHLNEVTVLDVRPSQKSFTGAPEFETDKKSGKKLIVGIGGHIDGAVPVDNKKVRVTRKIEGLELKGMIPERADFEKLARSWGATSNRPIVIVSAGIYPMDFNDAARLFWQFKVYGEDNIAVLNGGTAGWITAGKQISHAPVAPATGNWTSRSDRSAQFMATSQDVAKAQASQSDQLIDARSSSFYLRLDRSGAATTAGHIDGAKNLYTAMMSTDQHGQPATLYGSATYSDMFVMSGLNPRAASITYCNTGHQASGVWFVMTQIMGNHKVRLYDGSLHEWTHEKRPTVTARLTR